MPLFDRVLHENGLTLRRTAFRVLQVNVGKRCNQACSHCHVDAGPQRTEVMSRETVEEVLEALRRCRPQAVDITGGAPEMNPHFEHLVSVARSLGCHVIDRCNLTVLSVPGKTHLPEFLAGHGVEVIASLPCYLEENVDLQRGIGVFAASIVALRKLNSLGYGEEGSDLRLHLVYNPVGTSLPPSQAELEADYHRELEARFGIRFNRLYTLANMPIQRFAHSLRREGKYEAYMELLANAFNPATVEGLMCRDTVSVAWDGRLYDCDFNQMLDLPLSAPVRHVRDLDSTLLAGSSVAVGSHCFGCTAGAGSSCGGALID
ncbi:MAG: arsenosugar biosynthesis radical SAM protein ArsS [Armatimonadetes bacterium]|nr:arsenosugar biosynthesis radical SAM protein ArsS [Armatimonadota bacterium]